MACHDCPLQSLADLFPKANTRVTMWHERTGKPDCVQVSVIRDTEDYSADGHTCREAVAKLFAAMDERRTNSRGARGH